MRKLCSFTAALALLLIVAGCVSTSSVKQIGRLEAVSENPKILVITPDVKYYLLTAGGVVNDKLSYNPKKSRDKKSQVSGLLLKL